MRLLTVPCLGIFLSALTSLAACSSDTSDPADPGGDDSTTTDDTADSGKAALPEWKSGTRLRANLIGGTGDTRLFTGWYDKSLKSDCAFGIAEDGRRRCIPIGTALGNTFSDADCSLHAVVATPTCEVPAFVVGEATCDKGPEVYRMGSKLTLTTIFVKQQSGSCASLPANGQDVYEVVAKISANDLASAEESTSDEKDGLAVLSLVGEDGSVETVSAVDTKHEGLCDAKSPREGRCLPSSTAFEQTFFKDSACKTPAAVYTEAGSTCGHAPNVVVKASTSPNTCGAPTLSYASLGAKITGTVFQSQVLCEPSTEASGTFYEVGSDLAVSDFPALKDTESGSGRLQVRAAATSKGDHLLDRILFDSERKEECAPAPASDGKTRCMPISSSKNDVRYFSDTKCTKPVAFVSSGCTTPATVRLVTSLATACGEYNVRVFTVGAKTSPSTVYQSNGITCDATPAPSGTDLYSADEEVPASAFAEIETKTE